MQYGRLLVWTPLKTYICMILNFSHASISHSSAKPIQMKSSLIFIKSKRFIELLVDNYNIQKRLRRFIGVKVSFKELPLGAKFESQCATYRSGLSEGSCIKGWPVKAGPLRYNQPTNKFKIRIFWAWVCSIRFVTFQSFWLWVFTCIDHPEHTGWSLLFVTIIHLVTVT